ncbi:signal peptidase II [Candidatus Dependentiae bacterium]|nr:signal peptidase II [Candidatus Dependentiae bacterium]
MKKWISTGIIILLIDYLTKIYVKTNFFSGQSFSVISDFFKITYVKNEGIAFGMFQEHSSLFLFLTPAAIIILTIIFYKSPIKSFLTKIAFTFIITGAIGNYIDRLSYGFVIDFLDFEFIDIIINPFSLLDIDFQGYYLTRWPAFNIADSAISVGVAILFFESIILNFKKKEDNKVNDYLPSENQE